MRFIFIIALALFSFSVSGQLTQEKFNAEIAGHGWHPDQRGKWLFSGTHTISISKEPEFDQTYFIDLAGVNQDNGEKWRFSGKGKLTLKSNYFELELLNPEMHIYAKFIYGSLLASGNIQVAGTQQQMEMNVQVMERLTWFGSRY